MNQTTPAQVNLDTPALLSFIDGARSIASAHFNAMCTNSVALGMGVSVELDSSGVRYFRIVRFDMLNGQQIASGRSVHCFIDRTNGDVLKADSWKRPAKTARGNIFDASNGLARMTPYGAAYNRG